VPDGCADAIRPTAALHSPTSAWLHALPQNSRCRAIARAQLRRGIRLSAQWCRVYVCKVASGYL